MPAVGALRGGALRLRHPSAGTAAGQAPGGLRGRRRLRAANACVVPHCCQPPRWSKLHSSVGLLASLLSLLSVKREGVIADIKTQFREHKVRAHQLAKRGANQRLATGWTLVALALGWRGRPRRGRPRRLVQEHKVLAPPRPPLSPTTRRPSLPTQGLADAAKINHELAVALRSLEQLEAYAGMSRSSPELDISLKGSCD